MFDYCAFAQGQMGNMQTFAPAFAISANTKGKPE